MSVKGWTVVYKGARLQAEVLQAILGTEGIHAEVLSDTAYGAGIDLTDARLLVPDQQASHARRLLKEAEEAPETEPIEDPEEEV